MCSLLPARSTSARASMKALSSCAVCRRAADWAVRCAADALSDARSDAPAGPDMKRGGRRGPRYEWPGGILVVRRPTTNCFGLSRYVTKLYLHLYDLDDTDSSGGPARGGGYSLLVGHSSS